MAPLHRATVSLVAWSPVGPTLSQDNPPHPPPHPTLTSESHSRKHMGISHPHENAHPPTAPPKGLAGGKGCCPLAPTQASVSRGTSEEKPRGGPQPCSPGGALGLHKARHLWQGVEREDGHVPGCGYHSAQPSVLNRCLPGMNGETEASLSQRWPCLLKLNSPTLPLWGERMVPGASCLPGLSQLGAGLTQTPHPLAGGASFPEWVGQTSWLVLRAGLEATQILLQGPEKVLPGAPLGLGDSCTGWGQGRA